MKYPEEFEKYYAKANTSSVRHLDPFELSAIKRIAYNAWRHGKKIKDEELWHARSNGAFAYHFDKKIAKAVDSAMAKMRDELMVYAAQRAEAHWMHDD